MYIWSVLGLFARFPEGLFIQGSDVYLYRTLESGFSGTQNLGSGILFPNPIANSGFGVWKQPWLETRVLTIRDPRNPGFRHPEIPRNPGISGSQGLRRTDIYRSQTQPKPRRNRRPNRAKPGSRNPGNPGFRDPGFGPPERQKGLLIYVYSAQLPGGEIPEPQILGFRRESEISPSRRNPAKPIRRDRFARNPRTRIPGFAV